MVSFIEENEQRWNEIRIERIEEELVREEMKSSKETRYREA